MLHATCNPIICYENNIVCALQSVAGKFLDSFRSFREKNAQPSRVRGKKIIMISSQTDLWFLACVVLWPQRYSILFLSLLIAALISVYLFYKSTSQPVTVQGLESLGFTQYLYLKSNPKSQFYAFRTWMKDSCMNSVYLIRLALIASTLKCQSPPKNGAVCRYNFGFNQYFLPSIGYCWDTK